MTVKVDSTTDTAEQILAATGSAKEPVAEVVAAKPEVDTPAAPEAKTPDTTPEAPAATEDDEDDAEDSDGQPKKKKGGFQKKIDKLTKRASDAEAQLELLRRQLTPPEPKAPERTAEPKAAEGRPDPETFDTHAEYIEALADWKVEQRFKDREAKETQTKEKAAAEERNKGWLQKLEAGREKYDDFDEKMAANVPVSPAMAEVLTTSDVGDDLAYYLGSNPAEAVRIANMSPVAAARELGKIEAQFVKKDSAEAPVAKTKPKPVTPVSGRATANVSKNPDDMNFQEFKAWRNKQLSNRG